MVEQRGNAISMILVSACLAGFPCRWDGKSKADPRVIDLVRTGKAIPVCPEQLGGLPTPRQPAEKKGDRIFAKDGTDVTIQFQHGAAIVLAIAQDFQCGKAIFKARSPSCGKAIIYDGSFSSTLTQGDGVTADLLMQHGIEVYTEEDMNEPLI